MRKACSLILTAILLTACFAGTSQAEQVHESHSILIAFFSLMGNTENTGAVDATTSASIVIGDDQPVGTTEYVANLIQSAIGGEKYEIHTTEPYPNDFDAVIDQNHQEAAEGFLPQLKGSVENMAQYDTVFLGYPVWAGSVPQAIRAFLTSYDFSGKTIIPFCTHDGYGSGNSFGEIAALCPNAVHLEGFAIPATDVMMADTQVPQWLSELNISADGSRTETQIVIRFGDITLNGVLYDTPEARQFMEMLPVTISMWQYGGREFYGGIDGDIVPESEGQLFFTDGDITYCDQNNTVAIFYAQTDRPNLTMRVIPMGRVTSELDVLIQMNEDAEMTFALSE